MNAENNDKESGETFDKFMSPISAIISESKYLMNFDTEPPMLDTYAAFMVDMEGWDSDFEGPQRSPGSCEGEMSTEDIFSSNCVVNATLSKLNLDDNPQLSPVDVSLSVNLCQEKCHYNGNDFGILSKRQGQFPQFFVNSIPKEVPTVRQSYVIYPIATHLTFPHTSNLKIRNQIKKEARPPPTVVISKRNINSGRPAAGPTVAGPPTLRAAPAGGWPTVTTNSSHSKMTSTRVPGPNATTGRTNTKSQGRPTLQAAPAGGWPTVTTNSTHNNMATSLPPVPHQGSSGSPRPTLVSGPSGPPNEKTRRTNTKSQGLPTLQAAPAGGWPTVITNSSHNNMINIATSSPPVPGPSGSQPVKAKTGSTNRKSEGTGKIRKSRKSLGPNSQSPAERHRSRRRPTHSRTSLTSNASHSHRHGSHTSRASEMSHVSINIGSPPEEAADPINTSPKVSLKPDLSPKKKLGKCCRHIHNRVDGSERFNAAMFVLAILLGIAFIVFIIVFPILLFKKRHSGGGSSGGGGGGEKPVEEGGGPLARIIEADY